MRGGELEKMSSEEIFEKVKGIIVEQLGVTDTSVTMEASFIDDLGADSLDIVELVMASQETEKKEKLVGVVIRSPGSGLFCIPIPILSLQFRLERKTIRVGMSMPENVFSFTILHNPFSLFFARYQVIILK